jgi:hypothetical protein
MITAGRRIGGFLAPKGRELGRRLRDIVEAARRGGGGAREFFRAGGVFVDRRWGGFRVRCRRCLGGRGGFGF